MTVRGAAWAAAAAAVAATGAFTWVALRGAPPAPLPPGSGGPERASPARREAVDVVEAVRHGRLAAALEGVVSFLARFRPGDLGEELRLPFEEARLEAGRWGLYEAGVLAEGGEEEGAASLLRKASAALEGTGAEGEAAAAGERVRSLLESRRAAEEERRRREALEPAAEAVDAARAQIAAGRPEKALADLRAVLQTTTDPEARRLLEAEAAVAKGRLAGDRSRAGRRKRADAALSRGDYARAREILEELASDVPEGEAGAAEAARDAEKLEAIGALEENREPEALAAVRRALRWVVAQQLSDGSFSTAAEDGKGVAVPDAVRKRSPYRQGITGLVSLALLGHVRHDLTDEFEPALDRALGWILAAQGKDGRFPGSLYDHSICTLALVDADRLLHRTALREPAQRALDWLQEARNSDGGWRYSPRKGSSDVSVTGWALQALLHARMGRYEVKGEVVEMAFAYLDRMTDAGTGRTGYTVPGKGSHAMTAAALFCRLRNGKGPADPAVRKAADLIVKSLPGKGGWENCYHLFYASDAMSRLGGKWWKAWGPALKKFLLDGQITDGEGAGAWPVGRDTWAKRTGSVFLAAMNAISLENFFEHRE